MSSHKLQEKFLLLKLKLNPADTEAYARLYDLYVDKIYRFILFKVNHKEIAQDLTADVFLKVWQYLQNNKKLGYFKALLYQSARNLVIDHYRQKAKRKVVKDEDVMKNIIDERGNSIVEELEIKSEIKGLDYFFRKLKPEYQEILILKYIENYPSAEIAKILDKSRGNVRVLAHRALKLLQTLINEADNKPKRYD